jgi:hypothetical protein
MTSTDRRIVQLRTHANEVGKHMRSLFLWHELIREHEFQLENGTAAYAMPEDLDYEVFNTHWNEDTAWRVYGPMTPQEWQEAQNGVISSIRQTYRLKGATPTQFYINPTPGSAEDGQFCVFEYASKNWILPRVWATGQLYLAGQYTTYLGQTYSTVAGGTTAGASLLVDSGVIWEAYDAAYEDATADTDTCMINEYAWKLGVKAFFQRETRKEGWEEEMQRFYEEVRVAAAKSNPNPVICFGRIAGRWPNIPETGINNYV